MHRFLIRNQRKLGRVVQNGMKMGGIQCMHWNVRMGFSQKKNDDDDKDKNKRINDFIKSDEKQYGLRRIELKAQKLEITEKEKEIEPITFMMINDNEYLIPNSQKYTKVLRINRITP